MKLRAIVPCALLAQLAIPPAFSRPIPPAFGGPIETSTADETTAAQPPALPPPSPSKILLASLRTPALQDLAAEVLERNPDVERARRSAAAAAVRAPQVRAMPDPMAALTWFVLPPETRAGPQVLNVSIRQKLPWFGKLALREQAALYAAAAAEAEVEVQRLDVLTEARRRFWELAFLDRHETILKAERDSLVRYEEAARARYSVGMGLQQEILRIQSQITRSDARLLEIARRRASQVAAVNALRDRPASEPVMVSPSPPPPAGDFAPEEIRRVIPGRRPELAAADARIVRAQTLIELAGKNFRPDFTAGLGYTLVERRDDPAARAAALPDDGDDILALTGSVDLPVRRRKLEAGLEEALEKRAVAEEDRRRILAEIERSIGDLGARLPLLYEQWHLLEKVLRIQAREALSSAEAAYTTGKLNAIDLLDAEVVLFDVQTAAERTLTDWTIARAELERAAAHPLPLSTEEPNHDD